MAVLETTRLVLRVWTEGDVSSALALWGDAEVMRYVGDGAVADEDRVRRILEAGGGLGRLRAT